MSCNGICAGESSRLICDSEKYCTELAELKSDSLQLRGQYLSSVQMYNNSLILLYL